MKLFFALRAKRRRAIARCPGCGSAERVVHRDAQQLGLKVVSSETIEVGPVKYACRACSINFEVGNPSLLPGYEKERA